MQYLVSNSGERLMTEPVFRLASISVSALPMSTLAPIG